MKYEWKYGENDNQRYYDVTVGKDYLCVFANKWNPNAHIIAFAFITRQRMTE